MRVIILIVLLMISAGVAFAPTGVPLGVFSEAEPSKIPPTLLSAAKFEQLHSYAVSLAVRDSVDPRGPGMPQPETLLTYVRGRLFSGEQQMTAFMEIWKVMETIETVDLAADIKAFHQNRI